MDRRSFCRSVGGVVLGAATVSSVAAATERQYSTVSTRDHFVRSGVDAELAPGVGPTEYDVEGELPGLTTEWSPEELVVIVHGAYQSPTDVHELFPDQIADMERAGIDAEFVNYSYDSDIGGRLNWWTNASAAHYNGPKLAAFLSEYKRRSPSTTVRVLGYSLGCRPIFRAGEVLDEWDWSGTIDTATFAVAAVPGEHISLDGRGGPALESTFGTVQNFRNEDDFILNWLYRNAETTSPLGSDGAPEPHPSNYVEYDATDDIDGHRTVWQYDGGCIDRIAESWE